MAPKFVSIASPTRFVRSLCFAEALQSEGAQQKTTTMRIAIHLALLAIFLGAGFTAEAQKGKKKQEPIAIPELPMEGDKVVYTGVETVEGDQKALYDKALKWFNTYYKNPSSVITSKDESTFTIIGKHRFSVYMEQNGQQVRGPLCMYAIKVICKDGRYKYVITDVKQKTSSGYPIEKMVKDQRVKYEHPRGHHIVQMHEHCTAVAYALKKHMKTAAAAKAEDW